MKLLHITLKCESQFQKKAPGEQSTPFTRFCAYVGSECLFQQVPHLCRCLFLYLVRGMGVGGKGEPGAAVAQHAGYGLDIDSVLQGKGREGVPLRYNSRKAAIILEIAIFLPG